jgi:hypothetical protein
VENDVLNLIVIRALEANPIIVKHTEVVKDVLNLIVIRVPSVKPIIVYHTEVEPDVLNWIVIRVPSVKPINVWHTEAETDVLIVLLGLIAVAVHLHTMVIVRLVSNKYFLMMDVVKLYIDISKNNGKEYYQ